MNIVQGKPDRGFPYVKHESGGDFLEHRSRPGTVFFLTKSPQRLLVDNLIKEIWFVLGEGLPSPGDISQDSLSAAHPREACFPT